MTSGESLDESLSASDADGQSLTFSKTSGPFFVTVTTTGPTTGNLNASPGFADVGSFPITVSVTDGSASDSESITLLVLACSCSPRADAGGPYQGFAGFPVQFDGSGSSDPTGSSLTYQWDFGDGETGTGAQPVHTYASNAVYVVSLRVTNSQGIIDTDETTATIGGPAPATAFTTGGNGTVRLSSGKPRSCARIEPLGGAFQIEDVVLNSIVMVSVGTGSVDRISAVTDKRVIASDANNNGVPEIEACFSKDDLRQLFNALPPGSNTVTVSIEGDLTFGAHFAASLTLIVFGTGGALASSFRFEPETSQGVVTFVTTRPGTARVRLFDAQGRLVRSVLDTSNLPAGAHDIRVQARGGGAPL
ncbi:MAG TPA: PKD domain-containing protein, partial [Candidatus Eisenbacteria bacterium]|nr:PKD domain-containing protein [Candidatus Eisenbacteria bacterium]